MKKSTMSNCKNPECRSNKFCVCGGHNNKNHKKNKKHNSTKNKLNIKAIRKYLKKSNN